MPRHIVIANPESKRWLAYEADWKHFWSHHPHPPELILVPWSAIVPRLGDLARFPIFDRPAVVRLESPGRDDEVTRLLVAAGDGSPAEGGPLPKGLIWQPYWYYRGFVRVLAGLKESFAARPHLVATADPLHLAIMCDKTATARRLASAGVRVPEMLISPASAATLIEAIRAVRWPRAYVKLNTGASAVGMVALRMSEGVRGITTVIRRSDGFYNSRSLDRVTEEPLHDVLDFLIGQGAIVQRGVPMTQIHGENFDLRVVVLDGEPAFTLFRVSPHPMTNLHLGGRRGDWSACRALLPTRAWLDALDDAVAAAGCFQARMAGVDIVFDRESGQHSVLEVNAFGDFFPGFTDAQGRSTHQAQMERLFAGGGVIPSC